jgi:ligand-binding SRPBCC domain-containing protein
MTTHTLRFDQFLPARLSVVFPFFADAANLERITPPWVRFSILTPGPIAMRAGALIDYRIRVRGLPLRWRTEIAEWEPPLRFVDVQVRSPYRLWQHTHSFAEIGGGTLCRDEIFYAVWGGRLINRLFVQPDVERIFAHRRQVLARLFPLPKGASERGPAAVHSPST